MDINRLEKEFKEKFGKKSAFEKNKQQIEDLKTKMELALEKAKSRTPIKTRFVNTEFSRFKITMLKDNSIIITELKEEEANRLYDNIENAS